MIIATKPRKNMKHCKESKVSEIRLSKMGWGYFDVPMTIKFCESIKKDPITFEHELSFDGKGKFKVYKLQISKFLLDKVYPNWEETYKKLK